MYVDAKKERERPEWICEFFSQRMIVIRRHKINKYEANYGGKNKDEQTS